MTRSGRKHLCACGCSENVNKGTELRHQQGRGPLALASAILAQNWTLIGRHRKRKSSCQSVKCRVPASCGFAGASGVPNCLPDNDYPMLYSPPHSPPLILHSEGDITSNDVVSALSTTHRSQLVAERVNRISRKRWRTNHVQLMDERGDNLAEEEGAEGDLHSC